MGQSFRNLFFLLGIVSLGEAKTADSASWENDFRFENSNFTIDSQGGATPDYLYNYNRSRITLDLTKKRYFVNFIADAVHLYGSEFIQVAAPLVDSFKADTPIELQSKIHLYSDGGHYAKIYRANAGFEDDKNRAVLGIQKLSLGVGRIWTPSDIFNAKNPYALEPDEVFGVLALSYNYNISDLNSVTGIVSQRADKSFKYALRQKGEVAFGDLGFNLIQSDVTRMGGLEFEAIIKEGQLRGEMLYIESDEISQTMHQYLLGYDYSFENGLNLTVESYYSSQRFTAAQKNAFSQSEVVTNLTGAYFYLGSTLSYEINLYLFAGAAYVESFLAAGNSRYFAPYMTYTLNDYNTFTLGAQVNDGTEASEFGASGDTLYFNWKYSI